MGTAHYIVNHTKKQFLHPHRFGDGYKLDEIIFGKLGVLSVLALLLSHRIEKFDWSKDSIAIETEHSDVQHYYTNISEEVIAIIKARNLFDENE